jgi:RHS repeat-associated protein
MSTRRTNALWIGYCGTVLLITCWLAVWWISALSFVLWIGLMSLSAIMCLYGGIYRSRWFFSCFCRVCSDNWAFFWRCPCPINRSTSLRCRPPFSYDCTPRYVHSCALIASRSTGKERDTESGNDYFGARYYGSNMGRFMSPDYSMNSVILELPQSWNKYSYELNRPTYGTDPDGRCPWCVGAVVGGVIEGGIDAYTFRAAATLATPFGLWWQRA